MRTIYSSTGKLQPEADLPALFEQIQLRELDDRPKTRRGQIVEVQPGVLRFIENRSSK